jgi:3-phenylpropionate/trans-cinnamate dioxygenase ferredoxin reductase subunit
MTERVVIVGASVGGVRTAAQLRAAGFAGEMVLVGPEAADPYDRPPLSKQVLRGSWTPERASLGDPAHQWGAKVHTASAVGLDPARRKVELDSGETLSYDRLVIATGAAARQLPGPPLAGVHVLRTMRDCLALRADLARGGPLVVIGGGFIGAEVASTARALGLRVTIVEGLPTPMARVLGEETGRMLTLLHTAHGVRVRCGVAVAGLGGTSRVEDVVLSDGRRLPADVVAVGIGVTPNTSWLDGSGLEIRDGVMVDQFLAANEDRSVYAVGDVARWYDARLRRHVRVEHWTNATEQARTVADNILRPEEPIAHTALPYFWSDQHGAKIQLVGHVDPALATTVIEG